MPSHESGACLPDRYIWIEANPFFEFAGALNDIRQASLLQGTSGGKPDYVPVLSDIDLVLCNQNCPCDSMAGSPSIAAVDVAARPTER